MFSKSQHIKTNIQQKINERTLITLRKSLLESLCLYIFLGKSKQSIPQN